MTIDYAVNWTRLEGIVAVGVLLTSFVWFLGMPTGMAIGVGFGIVLLLDFVRSLLFDTGRKESAEVRTRESPSN
ncbi:hypothetical protein [Natronococcus wangiae]|uniref:hypothetical protein n=1 Tax=Natronococcus wangiae TaxID=3068275 RepID=UPI00273E82C9|nr:hypothetical protein [Natronococcus sp. AD5]